MIIKFTKIIITLILLSLNSVANAQFAIFQTALPSAVSNPNLRQENFFGVTGTAWNNFTGNYTSGLGNPAVSTDDWYHQNGLSGFRPYDLTAPECGAAGVAIAASRGRYAWPLAPDHGNGVGAVWNGSFDFRIGYSNDPGVPPARANFIYAAANPNNPSGVNASPVVSTITASISNGSGGPGNILNITAYTGLIANAGQTSVSGAGVTTAVISSQISGTSGQIGTYNIAGAAQLVASQTMTITQSGYFLYYDAQLVCNPDDATYPFYIYAEGQGSSIQHQMGVIKSSDLITWTSPQPTHNALNFGTWSSFQRVNRIGTGNWVSKGYENGYPQNGNVSARSTWTSTDGLVWVPGTTNLNWCLPASSQVGTTSDCTGASLRVEPLQSPDTISVGGSSWIMAKISTLNGGTRIGNQWVGRVAVDSNQSVIDTPAVVNVSSAYAGIYPTPSYLQAVTGYVEDGIAHYYAATGWPISNSNWAQVRLATYPNGGACAANPPANGQQGYFQFTGFASGTTLTVQSLGTGTIQIGSIIYGNGISLLGNMAIVNQINGTPNGIGDYTITPGTTVGSGVITGSSCGGLWQQGLDYYTEIIDSTAAATAAPIGVKASCSASTASLTWFSALPQTTYRLYRGTTAGSQTTLVGDFVGTSATDTGMSLNAITYYKLVYLHSGVEQKNRVVSTYCSTSSAFVNAHLTRAFNDGADMTTCNRSGTGLSLDAFDNWLTSNGLSNNILFATAADFCVAKSGSVITKIFDMGTTRLARGGDYTTLTANTNYNATGVGGKPAWVNSTNSASGYYGGDRSYLNNIRRKTQITIFSAYQKPGTAQAMFIASGQFASRMYLSHGSGSPGTVSCAIFDATQQKIATATPASATAFNTASCTFDGTNWLAWSNAVAGSAQTGLVIPSPNLNPPDALTGQIGSAALVHTLISGSDTGLYNATSATYSAGIDGLYSGRAQMIFDVALTGAQQTSLDALVR